MDHEGLSKLPWLAAGLIIGAILSAGSLALARRTGPAPIIIEPPPPTATVAPTATTRPLHVYVSGEVAHPDVYELPPGSIVADAVRLAGDFTAEAAAEMVNLAQPLLDGMQIHVPSADMLQAEPPVITAAAEGAAGSGAASSGREALLVNINTAPASELEQLPGIGPALAQRIVDYRVANGPFAQIEAIMEVSGIGEHKFEDMRAFITVE